MSGYHGIRIESAEFYQQIQEGQFLGLRSRILKGEFTDWLAGNVPEASDIDDADAVRIVALACK